MAQLNRASDYGSEGYRFESCANHPASKHRSGAFFMSFYASRMQVLSSIACKLKFFYEKNEKNIWWFRRKAVTLHSLFGTEVLRRTAAMPMRLSGAADEPDENRMQAGRKTG